MANLKHAMHAVSGYHSDCPACRRQIDNITTSIAWKRIWVDVATLIGGGLVFGGANGVADNDPSARTVNLPNGGVAGGTATYRAGGVLLGILGMFVVYVSWRRIGHRPVLVTSIVTVVAALLGFIVV